MNSFRQQAAALAAHALAFGLAVAFIGASRVDAPVWWVTYALGLVAVILLGRLAPAALPLRRLAEVAFYALFLALVFQGADAALAVLGNNIKPRAANPAFLGGLTLPMFLVCGVAAPALGLLGAVALGRRPGVVQIRPGRESDLGALEAVLRQASLANPGDRAFLEAHPEVMVIDGAQLAAGRIQLIEVGGAVGGFAALLPPEAGVCELDGLFVAPGRWREGLGSRLMEACLARARAEGAREVHALVNPHAVAFYLALGFHPSGRVSPEVAAGLAHSMTRSV